MLMSEKKGIETGAIDSDDVQKTFLPLATLIVLCVIAAFVPYLFSLLISIIMSGGTNIDHIFWFWIENSYILLAPRAFVIQAESLVVTFCLLSVVIFIWPKRFDEKVWCSGLILFFHAIAGFGLICLRSL